MGQMRFYAPKPEMLLPHAVELAFVAGLEAIPWRSTNSYDDHIMTIERSITESGNLYMPWLVPGIGQRTLSSCTLMEREDPYDLATELARGTLHRARSLAAEMEAQGRSIPEPARDLIRQSTSAMITATTTTPSDQEAAQQSILLASRAISQLSVHDVDETLDHCTSEAPLSAILIGPISELTLDGELVDSFTAAFHAVDLSFRWRQIQPAPDTFDWSAIDRQLSWSRSHGLRVIAGPLIQLDRITLPDWAYAMERDYEQFETAAIRYVQAAGRYIQDQVDIWVCAGRLNVPGVLSYSEEQKLRLAVATLEAVRSVAPQTPVVISFDQPWAEYLAAEDFDLSPLHFADALVRADLGVAGVGLEINLGYWPHGTQPRDLLAISRHLDRWSLLGIPLLVYLTLPSCVDVGKVAAGTPRPVAFSPDESDRPATSQDQAGEVVRLLLTKPAVHGIIWNQWSDAQEHEFPHSGLIDPNGNAKPLLATLGDIRRRYLN